jgi:hypothetical protein
MYHILGASHGGTGPATSHISRPYIRIVSAVKIYSRGVFVFLSVNTCISAKLIFHITVKERIWKFVPLN